MIDMSTEEAAEMSLKDSAKSPPQRRRLPTRRQLQVWRGYTETSEIIRARAASQLQRAAGLSTGDYQVLLALSEAAGNRLRSSELATAISWERSRLSHHLGRMEKRGLIRRERCAADSRGADAVLTEAGARAFRSASIPHLEAVRELFVDALSDEQLEQLEQLTGALRAHLGLAPVPDGRKRG
ncbi:MAG TPA: MarR family winged helix-turn-helix transcriptional regulator [Deinococcales bacterium]|nr:MarR family winged helix-turn-helix transcriptional regulator [Deinococcales bacterium]